MSRNAHDNKIGKITKYRRQFDDFYNFGKYGDCGEFLSNQFHPCWRIWRFWQILVKSPNVCKSVPYLVARQFWQILVKSPNVCKSVPYTVASHCCETGKYGDLGELLSNRQMYVPYLPVYKSTFYNLKVGLKNRPRLIHGSKTEIEMFRTN